MSIGGLRAEDSSPPSPARELLPMYKIPSVQDLYLAQDFVTSKARGPSARSCRCCHTGNEHTSHHHNKYEGAPPSVRTDAEGTFTTSQKLTLSTQP
ncbi:hypothetical protein KIL84_015176 [Mauremys mutica]|uniref:Uncharacterized protein n=1 Tax=Mauremys mutica TaxID=74926 RepID=A0A9D4APS5_9SAUR|nr:hypothetical protein KIL84_015176 [Mauremys mutica]